MQKEEKFELVSEKVDKILDQNKKHRSMTKSKKRKKKESNNSIKRIGDYFPPIAKVSLERPGENGVGPKDESRVTEHTSPDKANLENDKSQSNKPLIGKIL